MRDDPNDFLKLMIGDLFMGAAAMRAQIAALQDENAKLKGRADETSD